MRVRVRVTVVFISEMLFKKFFVLFLRQRKNFLNLNREIRTIFSICVLHDSNGIDDDNGGGGGGGFVFVYAFAQKKL